MHSLLERESPALEVVTGQQPSSSRSPWVVGTALALGLPLALLLAWPGVPDPDSFYHFAHARELLARGPLNQSFPWTAFSATGALSGDLWFGLHLVTAPFALIGGVLGMKLATAFLVFASLLTLWFAAQRLSVPLAWAGPALVFAASSVELARLLALRPQTVSLALFVLLLSLVVRGAPLACLGVGWSIAFLHQTLSWMAPAVVVVGLIAASIIQRGFPWKSGLVAVAGIALGWILRPGALDAARLMKIQILDLGAAKQADLPIKFGTEVYPYTASELFGQFPAFTVLWAAGLVCCVALFVRRDAVANRARVAFTLAAAVLSIGFYQVLMLSSARALEYWVAFAAVACVGSVGLLVPSSRFMTARRFALASVACLALVAIGGLATFMRDRAIQPDRFKPAMEWIAMNTPENSVVVTPHWDLFAEMFFWNSRNRYVQGMDPIFLLAHDPDRYWKLFYLAERAAVASTSGTPSDVRPKMVDTFTVLQEDFQAAAALIIKPATPELNEYMASDSRYHKGFEDAVVAVYLLKR